MTDVLIASGGKAQRAEKALCLGVEPGSFSHNSKKNARVLGATGMEESQDRVLPTLLYCWWERTLVQPLWKRIWRFPKRPKIEGPYDSAIPLLGIYLEKKEVQKDTCPSVFITALFTIAKT